MDKTTFRNIFLIWLGWALIVIGFQALATARFQPQWPDKAQIWTDQYTFKGAHYQDQHFFVNDPFGNNQVAWDSEYYIGIAVGGYNDPRLPQLAPHGGVIFNTDLHTITANIAAGTPLSLAYAFFPFYPLLMRLVSYPLGVLGLDPTATATLAGILVSALGALAAMLALYELTYENLGHEGGLRAAFYLLIFPTGFFLVQVYTEGLFAGLAFWALVMLRRRNWGWAAFFGALATLTRAVGVALIIPMAITWFQTREWYDLDLEWRQIYYRRLPLRPLLRGLLACMPLIAYLIWKFSYLGFAFDYIESSYFGRAFMDFGGAFYNWSEAFRTMLAGLNPHHIETGVNLQHSAYYFTEFLGMLIGFIAILKCLKTDPEVAWFSLAVFVISWASGPAQGIHRYVLGAPAVFITLARWGKNPVFDRTWTIASTLLMGLLAMLFAFNYWVA
jgi:hypothetical protein